MDDPDVAAPFPLLHDDPDGRASSERGRRSLDYAASLSSLELDERPGAAAAPRGSSVVSSLFDSFAPQPSASPARPRARRDSLDVDLASGLLPSGDLASGLMQSGETLATEPQASGYVSDSHVEHVNGRARAAHGEERYRPDSGHGGRPRRERHPVLKQALAERGAVAPGQPGRVRRGKDNVTTVHLRESFSEDTIASSTSEVSVTAYCIAFDLDLAALAASCVDRFGREHVTLYPEQLKGSQTADVLHARFVDGDSGELAGDVFFFEFGVVVTWNLSSGQEAEAVWQLAGRHTAQRIAEADIEVDELSVIVGPAAAPTLKDDSLSLSRRVYSDVLVRVSVSLALAQSTRISVQETQVMAMVFDTKELPFQLVETGAVSVPHDELAILIGKVFLQKSALNLQVLSGHKETPKFFWGKPDNLQVMYHAVSDYLDLDERADILNLRFAALTDMLDLLRDQQNTRHEEHLEWIIIVLIFFAALLGLLQIGCLLHAELAAAAGAGAPPRGVSAELGWDDFLG